MLGTSLPRGYHVWSSNTTTVARHEGSGKKYEHEQGGKNTQTNKQIPVRYRKDTGLQQCHQSEAPCLPRTLCSKGT